MEFEYEELKEIHEEELKIQQQHSAKVQTQRISGLKLDLGQSLNDDLITIKNTDDYNNYKKDLSENEDLFSKRIMVSGCASKDSEQRIYPRGSSLKTVGYGSVEKDLVIKKYHPEVVIESKMGKDRLMSLYAINSPTQQNY